MSTTKQVIPEVKLYTKKKSQINIFLKSDES